MKIFKSEYRVVTDNYFGYAVQKRRWWWPIWIQCGFTNTHSSLEKAQKYIKKHRAGETHRPQCIPWTPPRTKEVWREDA